MMRSRLFILMLLASLPLGLRAQAFATVPEYTMKAAYLYNFALLTTWPAAPVAPGAEFNLCLFGQDNFGPALDRLSGKEVNGQKIRIQRIDNPQEALPCQLVFISETNTSRIARLTNALENKPVLTISDDLLDDHLENIAMIRLFFEHKRLTFSINTRAAQSAQLQLSSKLLRLAAKVVAP